MKKQTLPTFPYYPKAIKKVFEKSNQACHCCGEFRKIKYSLPLYTSLDLPEDFEICPWCIKDGSAAHKFNGNFNDVDVIPGTDKALIAEITDRTPKFSTWQDLDWLFHCGKPAIFLKDASQRSVKKMSDIAFKELMQDYDMSKEDLKWAIETFCEYQNPQFYLHECSECKEELFMLDYS